MEQMVCHIIDFFSQMCVPEAVHEQHPGIMISAFTIEDYEKGWETSIRRQFTKEGSYYDDGYFNILKFLMNLCICLQKHVSLFYMRNNKNEFALFSSIRSSIILDESQRC